eukprot:2583767-Rhodomonas_salina.1
MGSGTTCTVYGRGCTAYQRMTGTVQILALIWGGSVATYSSACCCYILEFVGSVNSNAVRHRCAERRDFRILVLRGGMAVVETVVLRGGMVVLEILVLRWGMAEPGCVGAMRDAGTTPRRERRGREGAGEREEEGAKESEETLERWASAESEVTGGRSEEQKWGEREREREQERKREGEKVRERGR